MNFKKFLILFFILNNFCLKDKIENKNNDVKTYKKKSINSLQNDLSEIIFDLFEKTQKKLILIYSNNKSNDNNVLINKKDLEGINKNLEWIRKNTYKIYDDITQFSRDDLNKLIQEGIYLIKNL